MTSMTSTRLPSRGLRVIVAAALIASAAASAQAQQGIAAVVNDEAISLRDLQARMDLVVLSGNLPRTEEVRGRLAPQVLRGLIDEQIQLQEARRLGIEVTPEEIDRGIGLIAERNRIPAETLLGYLRERGVSDDALRRQVQAQIAWARVVGRSLQPRVVVTPEQVDLAAQAFQSGQGRPEYFLREIVLPVYDPAREAEVGADAERLVATLRQGADFASLASQVSASASAERGGAIGWVRETELPPDLVPIVQSLQPGQVSRPQRSANGFTIYFLESRRIAGGTAGDPSRVEVLLAQVLFPAPASASNDTIARLEADADAVRPTLSSCSDVERTARQLGLDGSGNLGWLRASDLPQSLAQAVVELPVGEISAPIRGPAGVHLLMVCDRRGEVRTEPVAADPEAIRRELEAEQLENLARRHLRDLRRQAFVDLRL
jgi:peptidyl-prolyl cis-trans isomerase SurA